MSDFLRESDMLGRLVHRFRNHKSEYTHANAIHPGTLN